MFPAEVFTEYLIGSVNKVNPRYRLSVQSANLSLPFGVRFQQADLFLKETPDMEVFSADSLRISPEIWSFLKGQSGFVFNCNAYGGNLKGWFRFPNNGIMHPFSASIKLKDVLIEDYTYFSVLIRRNSTGVLSGVVMYDGLTDGTGEVNLKITDGRLELQEPFFNLDSVEFEELLIKLALKEQKIDLSHVKLKGQEIQGTLSGTIRLNRDFPESSLDLKGTMEITSSFFKGGMKNSDIARFQEEPLKLPFVIYGTIREPKFKLT